MSATVFQLPKTPEGRELLRFILDCGAQVAEGYNFDRAAQPAPKEAEAVNRFGERQLEAETRL